MTALGLALGLFAPSILIAIYVSYHTYKLNAVGSTLFAGMSASLAIWLTAYFFEVLVTAGTALDTLLIQMHFIGINGVSVLLFFFAIRYSTGYSFSRGQYALVSIIPAITLIAAFTNPWHNLFWTGVTEITQYGFHFSKLSFGPFLTLHSLYSYFLILIASFIFLRMAFTDRQFYLGQAVAVFIAISLPLSLSILYVFNAVTFTEIDPAPFSLTVSQVLFLVALYRTGFHSVVPGVQKVGWRQVSYTMSAGVAITDTTGNIVETNPLFIEMFDMEPVSAPRPITSVVDFPISDEDDTYVTSTLDKTYRVNKDEVKNNANEVLGYVYTVNDITQERQVRQQIRVLNRFLRHNLRNELSIILLNAERFDMVDPADPEKQDELDSGVESIRERVDKLTDMSDSVRVLEKTFISEQLYTNTPQDIITSALAEIESSYPVADIELTYNTNEAVEVCENFKISIEQLLKNVYEHNNEEVSALVTVEDEGDTVAINIEDDGKRISKESIESFQTELQSDSENQLMHGVGLGFGIAYWLVTQSGGEMEFTQENELGGSTVTLRLQKYKP